MEIRTTLIREVVSVYEWLLGQISLYLYMEKNNYQPAPEGVLKAQLHHVVSVTYKQ